MHRGFVAGLIASVLLAACVAAQVSPPRITTEQGQHILELSAGMQQALQQFDREFTVREESDYSPDTRSYYEFTDKQAPFAAIGDFNGDGKLDVVVDGDNRSDGRRLLILSSGSSFHVREVQRFDRLRESILQYRSNPAAPREPGWGPGYGLSLFPRQSFQSHWEEQPLELTHDAFVSIAFGKAGTVVYLEGDELRRYTISD